MGAALQGRAQDPLDGPFKRVVLQCEKTERTFGSMVAVVKAVILIKTVHAP